MVKKNKIIGIGIFILAVIAFVWIVMAAAGDGVVLLSPASGTNYSTSAYFSVNYTNNSDITNPQNATFYYNLSGAWVKIGNTSEAGGCSWTNFICNVTLNVSGLTEGIYSINATIDNGTRRVSARMLANLSNVIRFDLTSPAIYNANISSPVAYSNHSIIIETAILINVSIFDTSSADYVLFNVTNSSGKQNATFPTVRTGNSFYNNSLNSSQFPDGTYTITVWANDTAGNLNNTASVTIVFDNTKPSVYAANISSPINVSNYTGTVPLNVSVVDVLAGIGTVIFEIRNKTGATNGTNFTGVRESSTRYGYSLNTANFLNGAYNITVWVNDSAGNSNNSVYIKGVSGFIFDNTPPIVYSANITSPNSNSVNYSDQLGFAVFNVSLLDTGNNGVGAIDTVIFNVTNGTGNQNATFIGVREGTSDYYSNNTINVTAFADGRYTVKVWANDTAGATNDTASRTNTGFDVNVPDISFSCTPASVKQTETVTCTCTASDSLSGLNLSYGTSGIYYQGNSRYPSTSQTGTFTTYCYSRDNVENSATKSFTYAVESGTGSGGSSGSGGGETATWTTYSVNNNQFTTGYAKDLKESQRLEVSISNAKHYVGVISISATSAKIEVSSTPQQVNLAVGETKKFEVTGDNFRDISVTLNSISNKKAKITVQSIYEEIPAEAQTPTPSATPSATAPLTSPEEGKANYTMAIIVVLIILVIAVIIWFVMKKKNR